MLDPEMWTDFVQHRKDIKKPLSPVAEKRMLSRLSRFVEQGMNVNAMLGSPKAGDVRLRFEQVVLQWCKPTNILVICLFSDE